MKQRILLIDDEELITRTLAGALEKAGYEVMVAKNGADAVVMAEEEDFDLVISDIRMPGPDGVATVKKIMATAAGKGKGAQPAIFMTGYADDTAEKKARELKPQAFFYKPFDYPEFLLRVRRALEARPARRP